MHSLRRTLATACLLGTIAAPALAQQWVNPGFDPHRLDFRDLGYPTQNLVPADDSRITALLSHSNGFVYGATGGRAQSYLFFFNRFTGKVRPLGRIAGAQGVYHGLLEGKDGSIYIGTGLNVLAPVKLTRKFPVAIEAIEHQLWQDIQAVYRGYEGGHVYRYDPKTGDTRTYTNDDPSPLEDLGIPVPGNTVYAMTWSPDKSVLYGLSYPDAHFFVFDVATRNTRDLGDVVKRKVFSGPERDWRTVPRALYCDPNTGRVYSSGENGLVWRYDPKTERIEETDMRLPGEYYESLKSIDFPVFECFDTDGEGRVYAGTNDGHLVRLDFERETLVVLGKPRLMRRMRAMKVALDGRIYMLTGELDRICKLHTVASTSLAVLVGATPPPRDLSVYARPVPAHVMADLPFAMTAPVPPVFPGRVLSIADYGAVPDGVTLNTRAFAAAIAACATGGGGLHEPPGRGREPYHPRRGRAQPLEHPERGRDRHRPLPQRCRLRHARRTPATTASA